MLSSELNVLRRKPSLQLRESEFQAELLPSDKVLFIESLIERYQSVGMVGDGINDAPAMGRASIGIAMGAIGSDTANRDR